MLRPPMPALAQLVIDFGHPFLYCVLPALDVKTQPFLISQL